MANCDDHQNFRRLPLALTICFHSLFQIALSLQWPVLPSQGRQTVAVVAVAARIAKIAAVAIAEILARIERVLAFLDGSKSWT